MVQEGENGGAEEGEGGGEVDEAAEGGEEEGEENEGSARLRHEGGRVGAGAALVAGGVASKDRELVGEVGECAGEAVEDGEGGGEHDGERGEPDDPSHRGPEGFAIEADELGGEGGGGVGDRGLRLVQESGTEKCEAEGEEGGTSVADVEVEESVTKGDGLAVGAFDVPEGLPDGDVNRAGHPSGEGDEEGEVGIGEEGHGGQKPQRGEVDLGKDGGGGGEGSDGEDGDEDACGANEGREAAGEEKECADAEEEGREEEGMVGDAEEGAEESGGNNGDAGLYGEEGTGGDEEVEREGPSALVAVGGEERGAAGGGVLGAEAEGGILEQVGEKDDTDECEAVACTCAGGLDKMGDANGRAGEEKSGAEAFDEGGAAHVGSSGSAMPNSTFHRARRCARVCRVDRMQRARARSASSRS